MKFFKKIFCSALIFSCTFSIITMSNLNYVLASETSHMLSISGSSTVEFEADMAQINISVQTQANDALEAQKQNKESVNTIISDIKECGVNSSDIKTQDYYLYPVYDYQNDSTDILGYTVQENIVVTVRELDKIDTIIDVAIEDGATISGVYFGSANYSDYYNQALIGAIQDGTNKANMIAQEFSYDIGSPDDIVEVTQGQQSVMQQSSVSYYDSSLEKSQIIPGKLSTTAYVNLIFYY